MILVISSEDSDDGGGRRTTDIRIAAFRWRRFKGNCGFLNLAPPLWDEKNVRFNAPSSRRGGRGVSGRKIYQLSARTMRHTCVAHGSRTSYGSCENKSVQMSFWSKKVLTTTQNLLPNKAYEFLSPPGMSSAPDSRSEKEETPAETIVFYFILFFSTKKVNIQKGRKKKNTHTHNAKRIITKITRII